MSSKAQQNKDLAYIAAAAVLAYLFFKGQEPEGIPAQVIALDESPLMDWAEAEIGFQL